MTTDDPTPASDEGRDEAAPTSFDPSRYEGIDGHAVRETSGCERELLAVVPRDQFESLEDAEAQKMRKVARLKGFRPGKAPVGRVKAAHAKEIREKAVQALIEETWKRAIEADDLRPLDAPALTEFSLGDDGPVRFALRFEVFPQVSVSDIGEVSVESRTIKITDADVEEEVEGLRSACAKIVDASKDEAGPGDLAEVDICRWAPGQDRETDEPEEHRERVIVEVGADGNLPELDKALLGMGVGETRPFVGTYPKEHQDPELAGADVPFDVTLHGIKERELPELDDEFVQSVGEWKTVDEMRNDIRERIVASRRLQAEREQESEVISQLLERVPFDIPRSLVDREAELRLRAAVKDLASRGIDPEEAGVDWRSEFGRAREMAERGLRAEYLLSRLAEEKGIEVGDDDLASELETLATHRKTTAAELRRQLEKSDQLDDLRTSLRRRRTLELLRAGATVTVE